MACIRARVTILLRRSVRCFLALSTFWSASALAADPLNSYSRPEDDNRTPITQPPDSSHPDAESEHTDTNLVPVVGGSTDLGIGGGYFAGIARVKPGADPYLWNVDSSALITFKYSENKLSVPYQDFYARLTVPRLFGSPLRLEVRPSYTWESIEYFGMGDASSVVAGRNTSDQYFKYTRGHPQFDVDVRTKIVDHFIGRFGFRYIYNKIDVPTNSKLADDRLTGSDEVKRLIGSTDSHSVFLLKYGLQWDTRDNETSTHSGTFDTVDVKLSPGGTTQFPHRYGEATLNLRGFLPLGTKRITLATRVVGDWMFGDVPFYELARFDDTFALGGSTGVRGVPAQRYYGKLKLFGNAELRMEVGTFHALGKQLTFAVVPLFDAGRLWADASANPDLDGRGFGLKYGYGGGVRVQSGSSFVIRAELAASPDATPISGYFAAGQAF